MRKRRPACYCVPTMGMSGILIALSEERRRVLEADPGVLDDVIGDRRTQPIPGLLDIGKAWDALSQLLEDGPSEGLASAITAAGGTKIGEDLGFGRPRVVGPDRVAEIAQALVALPPRFVADRYARLDPETTHGRFGPEIDDDAEASAEIASLDASLRAVVEHYVGAARQGHSMLAVVV